MGRSNVMSFWGKTRAQDGPNFKPLLHHLLDVAAAALALQRSDPARLARDAALLGIAPDLLARGRSFCAGLHDLGKVAKGFQQKSPAHFPVEAFGAWDPASGFYAVSHWQITGRLLQHELAPALQQMLPSLLASERNAVAYTLAGHHGRPQGSGEREPFSRDRNALGGAPAVEAAREMARILYALLGAPVFEISDEQAELWTERFCWGLAGLTTLADWVGSDDEFFMFEDPLMLAADYWPRAQGFAAKALAAKRLAPAAVASDRGLAALFPEHPDPRPLQARAEALDLPEGPVVVVIEDATGSGKTEAALVLAQRMMAAGKAEGIFFALPTMATANAMFERLGKAYRRLFEPDTRPSLALLHGKSALSEAFEAVRLAGQVAGQVAGQADRDSVAAECGAWFADDRRRAFFAQIGAGTIDQALMAVLPKKFLALRQYGLAGKVLIVDEAHSYDAYMGEELTRLLEFHARLGGSAIVLSATLPQATRAKLVSGFTGGMQEALKRTEYPLVTLASADTLAEVVVKASAKSPIAVERLGNIADALDLAAARAASGAAVAFIRNAVDDALSVYSELKARGCDVTLFHARFALADRLAIEKAAVADFGKAGEKRAGRIMVATDVISLSLDLCFDAMITDLAPVDLLIQRAGRLWRHERKERPVSAPVLHVLSPDWQAPEGLDWLGETQPKGRYVYGPGITWRSAKVLFEEGAIAAPGGLRALIEAAYGDAPLPAALESADLEWEAKVLKAPRAIAQQNLIRWSQAYHAIGGVGADQEIGTRLGAETVTLRLAKLKGDALIPWAEDADAARAWALSEVSVRKNWLERAAGASVPASLGCAMQKARLRWPDFECDAHSQIRLGVVVDGAVTLEGGGVDVLRYDRQSGLKESPSQLRG
ncbi:MAG: CRISPR-associated helicase Cas3' [Neomegalonema sp.]|nr:CRISPR-associated helicase Cas3' [Neomegalonema sp.]